MSKIKTTILLTILLASTFTAFLPFAKASTGYIIIHDPAYPHEIEAGGTVTLNFSSVTFSGGQFYLVWSADGYSQISSGDFKFSPVFKVSDLHASAWTEVGDFEIGYDQVVGPIPKEIAGGEYYVKAFDGSATSVAVTSAPLIILPSFEVVPEWGPGGCSIQLKGYAFSANNYVNLSYWDPVEGEEVTIKNLYATDSIGKFVYSMLAPDLKLVVDADENLVEDYIETITFYALDNKTGYPTSFDWDEYPRGLIQVDDITADWEDGYLFGNETYFNDWYGLEVEVFEELVIAGNYFHPGNVTFWFDGSKYMGSVAANQTGFFNTTVTIPETSVGEHYILIKDAGLKFVLYLDVIPTLVLEPSKGPVGTVVTVKAYGFPEKILVLIWWYEKSYGEDEWYNFVNGTTGTDGKFNVTVKFTVPHAYGGDHIVEADDIDGNWIAETTFTITPTMWIEPATFTNDGSLVTVYGTGFDPTIGYTPNIDNNYLAVDPQNWDYPSSVYANETGDLNLKFVAAGFAAGVHVFSMYAGGELEPSFILFTVTGTSPDTQAILAKLNATSTDLTTKLNSLINSVGSLSSAISALNSLLSKGVLDIRNDIVGVKNDVAMLSEATTKGFNSVNSALGTLSSGINSLGQQLSGKIDNVGSSVNNVGKAVTDNANSIMSAIQSQQTALSQDIKSSVGDLSTFLIIIGILAAIVLVVEVAILIRRLS
ncbi:MAG: hypothetical protein QXJ17_05265 [Nitrososphaeria archaeon]